jgi:hypothetical protein
MLLILRPTAAVAVADGESSTRSANAGTTLRSEPHATCAQYLHNAKKKQPVERLGNLSLAAR